MLADRIDNCSAWYRAVATTRSYGAPSISTARGTKSKPRPGIAAVSVLVPAAKDGIARDSCIRERSDGSKSEG